MTRGATATAGARRPDEQLKHRRPDLDGLRALAVLGVFLSHSGVNRAEGGWIGVDVFFVLSGYLITTLLLAERAETGRVRISVFYARRALRLYPALLLVVALGAFFWRDLSNDGTFAGYVRPVVGSILYVQDFVLGFTGHLQGGLNHTWTLAIEEQFYLVWPLFLLLAKRRALLWTCVGIAGSWVLLVGDVDGVKALALPWVRCSTLLLGCAVALVLDRRRARGPIVSDAAGWLLTVAMMAVIIPIGSSGRRQEYSEIRWMEPVVGLLVAALLIHLTAPSSLRGVLSIKPLEWLGRRSYGFYLYHYPVIVVTREHLQLGKAPLLFVQLAITLAVTVASYQFAELPFLKLKRRFEPVRSLTSSPTDSAAAGSAQSTRA